MLRWTPDTVPTTRNPSTTVYAAPLSLSLSKSTSSGRTEYSTSRWRSVVTSVSSTSNAFSAAARDASASSVARSAAPSGVPSTPAAQRAIWPPSHGSMSLS